MKATGKHLLALTTTVDEVTNEVKPLFAFPVDVVKATEDQTPKWDVAAPSGAKRKQTYVDTATGEVVEDSACPRGVFVGDEFKAVDQAARDEIAAATKIETMVALDTLPLADFRAKYGNRIVGLYYLQVPAKGGSAMAYRLTYEALKAESRVVVTKRTARSKQKLAAIYADDGFLAMVELQFADAVREPDAQVKQPQTVEVAEKQVKLARKMLANIGSGDGHALDTETDEAVAMTRDLMEKAVAGEAISAPTPIKATVEQDDLEAALTASLSA